ncbi:hypothetical protein F1880_002372 [Penicillium rolfsii]|nr:hypothetical protein F1880_002372 [Penicillium rolfsii]
MIQDQPKKQPSTGQSTEQLDPASRRRLQNRLNQRASHKGKRKQAEKQKEQRGQRWIIYTDEANVSSVTPKIRSKETPVSTPTPETSPTSQDLSGPFTCGTSSQLSPLRYIKQLKKEIVDAAGELSPTPSLVHSVKQFNVMRAMFQNAAIMELTIDALTEDIASSFNIAGPITFNLPPSLQPSSTQKQIIHHPWIDLLPVQSFRDNLIVRMAEYDDEELCRDLYGMSSCAGEVGLIVWGESWDPCAYELSEEVVRKWSWILKDSPELLISTNFWRRKRGEKALKLLEPRDHFIHEIE